MPTFSFRYSIYPEFFDQWPHFSQLSRYSSIIKMMALVKPMACENRSSVRDFDVIGSNSIGYWPRNLRLRGYWLFDGMGIGAKGVRNNLYVSMYLLTSSTGPLSVSQSGSQPANRPAENSHTWAELEDMPFHLLWLEGGDHYYAIFFQCLIQMIKKLKRVSNYFYLIYGQQIQSHFYILLFAELLLSCDL